MARLFICSNNLRQVTFCQALCYMGPRYCSGTGCRSTVGSSPSDRRSPSCSAPVMTTPRTWWRCAPRVVGTICSGSFRSAVDETPAPPTDRTGRCPGRLSQSHMGPVEAEDTGKRAVMHPCVTVRHCRYSFGVNIHPAPAWGPGTHRVRREVTRNACLRTHGHHQRSAR